MPFSGKLNEFYKSYEIGAVGLPLTERSEVG